jgi:V/A-type H+-transporting ATPase subunit D
LLERDIEAKINSAYPALQHMLMATGGDRAARIANAVHYDFQITEKTVTMAGMTFSSIDVKPPKPAPFYSFMGTGADVDRVVIEFFSLLDSLTDLASIRTIVWRLAMEVKKTQRRVNALDKMVIPQTKETKIYIESVLEERERENTFVLKALKARHAKR